MSYFLTSTHQPWGSLSGGKRRGRCRKSFCSASVLRTGLGMFGSPVSTMMMTPSLPSPTLSWSVAGSWGSTGTTLNQPVQDPGCLNHSKNLCQLWNAWQWLTMRWSFSANDQVSKILYLRGCAWWHPLIECGGCIPSFNLVVALNPRVYPKVWYGDSVSTHIWLSYDDQFFNGYSGYI